MATIEELDFQLVLQDNEFDKKVSKLKNDAQKLNTELSNLLTVLAASKVVKPEDLQNMQKMNALLEEQNKTESKLNNRRKKRVELEREITAELQKQAATGANVPTNVTIDNSKTINNMRTAQEGFNKEVSKSSKLWMQLKNLTTAYFSVMGASRLISNLIRVSAEFEKQRISLEAILKDVNGADRLFNQMKELAVRSPFQFKELVTYTKQLSAFSVPMEELYDTTKMLADVSAGLGVGMDRLILAYGQIRSASFLRGQEVRQLTEAGVPILEELRKQFEEMGEIGITAGQVFDKISARQVTFEMVEKVFKNMTSEGGKFYQMQEVLAETLSGKISNLKDAYQIMFAEIGEKSNGILVKSVDALRSLAENYEKVGKAMLGVVAAFGVYKTGVLISTISNWIKLGKAANSALPMIKGFTIELKKNEAAMKVLAALSKINPYAALAAGAVAAVAAIIHFSKEVNQGLENQKAINKAVEDYNKDIDNEKEKLRFLIQQLDKAEKGTAAYDAAKKKIIDNYGQYLSDLDKENLALGNQVDLYAKLIPALEEASRAKVLDTGLESIGNIFTDQKAKLDKDFKGIINYIKNNKRFNNVTQETLEQLGMYYRSEINYDDFTEAGKEIYKAITEGIKQEGSSITAAYTNQFTNNYQGDAPFNIDELRNNLATAKQVMADGAEQLSNELNILFGPDKPAGQVIEKEWQKTIDGIIKEAAENDVIISLKLDDASNVIEEVRNRLEETSQKEKEYAGIEDAIAESYHKQWIYYQRINQEALKGRATPGGTGSSSATTKNPRVEQIKDEIDAYKELKSVYEGFANYMDEESAKTLTKSFLGNVYGGRADADYDEEIKKLTEELEDLALAGDDAALSLFGKVQSENAKNYQKELDEAAKTTKEFEEMIKGLDDVFSLAGLSGVSLDIAKIGRDYRDSVNKIAEERAQAIESLDREALKSKMSDTEYEDLLNRIFGSFDIKEANERAEAVDKVRESIEKYYTEARDFAVDFNNLGDKSITQLQKMKDDISELAFKEIDPKVMESYEAMGMTIDDVISIIEKLIQGDLEKLDEETKKLTVKSWKQIASNILEVTDALRELGEEAGNQQLVDFANFANGLADVVKSAAAGFTAGGPIGAIIGGVSAFAVKMLEVATNAERVKNELKEIATKAYLEDMSKQIAATSTIFGDSWLGKITLLQSKIVELRKEIELLSQSTGGSTFFGTYNAVLGEKLSKYAKELRMVLYDEDGTLNSALLEAVDTQYSKELKSLKIYDEFKDLKAYNDKLKELFEELDSTVGQIFSDIGESITDEIIDKLNQTGEVVTELEDVFQGLGDSIMKSLIQSVIVDEILAKYKDEVKSWFTAGLSADEVAARLDGFAQNVRSDIEAASGTIKGIYDAFKDYNLVSGGDSSENGLSNGIKGVTEETASLLASYINAIRADVAYNRLQLEDIRGDVRLMLGLLPQVPNLAEYLTQIQANTYNSAERSRMILEHLQDLTTADGGAAALRVYM